MAVRQNCEKIVTKYGGRPRKRFLLPFWDRRSVPQLNGDDTLKLRGLCPLSNQARGALGPQKAVKNGEFTARPQKEREISFWAVLRTDQ